MIDESDPIVRGIRALAVLTPDARRSAVVRARCRAGLRHPPARQRPVGAALVGSLCVLYLVAIVLDVLRLRGRL
jgi:hypothetical protein